MITWRKRLNDYGLSDAVIILLLIISIISIAAEIFSIGIFLPLFELINQNNAGGLEKADSEIVRYMYNITSFVGLRLSAEVLLILSFILFLISKIFLYITVYVQSYYRGLIIKNMKDKLLHNYLHASASYYDNITIGDFTNSSFVELPAAVGGVMLPIKLVITIMTGFGSIVVLFAISPYLTIMSICIVGIGIIVPSRWIKATIHVGKKNSRYSSVVTSFLLNRLQSPRLVRLSNTASLEEEGYSLLTEKHRKLTLAIQILKARITLVLEPMIIGISLLMFYIALVILEMSVSIILLYMIVMVRIVPIVTNLLTLRQSLNRAVGPMQAIDKLLLDMGTDIDNYETSISNDNLINDVNTVESLRFDNLSFNYKGYTNNALLNISHTFNKSSLTAIVGPSGSGKTTFVDIVSGYRKQTSGNFFLNDVDMDKYNPKVLISLVSYVPQFPQIFDGITIYEHIAYGMENSTKREVINASKLSGAYDFIKELPLEFDTVLTGKSSGLSGGQMQRIDLSRALLRDKPILILDEPTGSLDVISEKKFMSNINKIRRLTGKIIIIIAHRVYTITNADQIIVLEGGQISDTGNHSELILNNSWYKKVVEDF
jgi:ABC-type multidrug transport system fused ATPase/permease subunit